MNWSMNRLRRHPALRILMVLCLITSPAVYVYISQSSNHFGREQSNSIWFRLTKDVSSTQPSPHNKFVNLVRATAKEQDSAVTAAFKLVPGQRNVSHPSLAAKGIPKIIHQTWKKQETVPVIYKKWMSTWSILLARDDWEYWFWTDEDMRRFVVQFFLQYLDMYDKYPTDVHRADTFRYLVIYKYGGMYVDLDVDCLKSINALVDQWECAIVNEPLEHAHFIWNMTPPLLSSGHMACRPSHDLFSQAIASIKGRIDAGCGDAFHCTGPAMLTDTFKKYNNASGAVEILEPDLFNPTPYHSWKSWRAKCNEILHPQRPDLHKIVCKHLSLVEDGTVLLPSAYTNHHWTSIYLSEHKHLLKDVFNVAQLTDDVNDAVNKELKRV